MGRGVPVATQEKLTTLMNSKLSKLAESIEIEHSSALHAVNKQAEIKAMELLGIADLGEKGERNVILRKELEKELREIHKEMDERLDEHDDFGYGYHGVEASVSRKANNMMVPKVTHFKRILLEATEFGKELNRIEEAKEEMTERILLATLPGHLTEIANAIKESFGV